MCGSRFSVEILSILFLCAYSNVVLSNAPTENSDPPLEELICKLDNLPKDKIDSLAFYEVKDKIAFIYEGNPTAIRILKDRINSRGGFERIRAASVLMLLDAPSARDGLLVLTSILNETNKREVKLAVVTELRLNATAFPKECEKLLYPILMRLLREDEVGHLCAKLLTKMSDEFADKALPDILQIATSHNDAVWRSSALRSLAYVNSRPVVVDAILHGLRDASGDCKNAALSAAVADVEYESGHPGRVSHLENWEPLGPVLTDIVLREGPVSFRVDGLDEIRKINRRHSDIVIGVLLKAMNDESPAVRRRAIWCLNFHTSEQAELAKNVVKQLTSSLHDCDTVVGFEAAKLLWQLGEYPREATGFVVRLLESAERNSIAFSLEFYDTSILPEEVQRALKCD